MADKKISELTGAGALTGTEEVPIVQGGVTVKTTTQDIADLGGGGGGAVDSVNGQTGAVVLDATDVGAEPTLGFTPENVANKATSLTSPDNTKYPTTQLISDYLVPTASTGNSVSFDKLRVYNYGSPATGNITEDLTGAKPAIVQVFYHQQATAFTVPAGWVLIGGEFSTTLVNKIFVEWISGTTSHYWVAQLP